jgi:uridine kinase
MDVLIIGIAGGSGSGKSTLTRNIVSHFGDRISHIHHDDYYKRTDGLSPEERAKINFDHPDAFDTDLLIKHLGKLKSGISVDAPIYDYKTHNRSSEVRRISPTAVIVVEGILIFENEELCRCFDMKIFVDTDPDVRIIRRIIRDIKKRGRTLDSVVSQYLTTVKPMHDAFVEPSKRRADIIIPEGGKNPVAYETIIDRIEKHFKDNE